jgi:hypothetical protein
VVSPLRQPLDPSTVTEVLLGGQWLAVVEGSFQIGSLRVGPGASGEAIRNDIWFSAEQAEDGVRFSGPFGSIQAVRH